MEITFGEIHIPTSSVPTPPPQNTDQRSKGASSGTSSTNKMTFPLQNMQIFVPKSRRGKKQPRRTSHPPDAYIPDQEQREEVQQAKGRQQRASMGLGTYNALQTETTTNAQPSTKLFDSWYRPSNFLETTPLPPLGGPTTYTT